MVKGIVCRNLYREPDYRCSADEDVLIPGEQFEKCHELFLHNGMKQADPAADIREAGEVPYYREGGALCNRATQGNLFSSESAAYGELNAFRRCF